MYVPDKLMLQPKVSVRLFCRNIYGVGKQRANLILKNYGLFGYVTMHTVTTFFHRKLIDFIDSSFITEKSLSNVVENSLQNEKEMQSVRGWRLLFNLPVNGQRTHTNGRTAKRLSFNYYIDTKRERIKKASLKLNFYSISNSKDRRKALRKHFKKFKRK